MPKEIKLNDEQMYLLTEYFKNLAFSLEMKIKEVKDLQQQERAIAAIKAHAEEQKAVAFNRLAVAIETFTSIFTPKASFFGPWIKQAFKNAA